MVEICSELGHCRSMNLQNELEAESFLYYDPSHIRDVQNKQAKYQKLGVLWIGLG